MDWQRREGVLLVKPLVAFMVSVFVLGAFAFSALFETPCASVAGQAQLVSFTSDPPPGWEFCAPFVFPGDQSGPLTNEAQP